MCIKNVSFFYLSVVFSSLIAPLPISMNAQNNIINEANIIKSLYYLIDVLQTIIFIDKQEAILQPIIQELLITETSVITNSEILSFLNSINVFLESNAAKFNPHDIEMIQTVVEDILEQIQNNQKE